MRLTVLGFRLLLIAAIVIGIISTLREQRRTADYAFETESIRAMMEDIVIDDPAEIVVQRASELEGITSALYFLPANREFEILMRLDSKQDPVLVALVPASGASREGLLQVETIQPEGGPDSIRVFGLTERPITIEIPGDEKLVESDFLGYSIPVSAFRSDYWSNLRSRGLRSRTILNVTQAVQFPGEHGKPESETMLQKWMTDSRDPNVLKGDRGALSIGFAEESNSQMQGAEDLGVADEL